MQEDCRLTHKIVLIPGDGIGPEVAEATRRVLEATGVSFEWNIQEAGQAMLAKYGTPLPDSVTNVCVRYTGEKTLVLLETAFE